MNDNKKQDDKYERQAWVLLVIFLLIVIAAASIYALIQFKNG